MECKDKVAVVTGGAMGNGGMRGAPLAGRSCLLL